MLDRIHNYTLASNLPGVGVGIGGGGLETEKICKRGKVGKCFET